MFLRRKKGPVPLATLSSSRDALVNGPKTTQWFSSLHTTIHKRFSSTATTTEWEFHLYPEGRGSVNNLVTCSFSLKGLSHEIFTGIFWLEWIYLGLKENRFCFFYFKDVSSILDSYFKYWCVSYQTFSEIRRISEKDWQLSTRFSNFCLFWVSGPPSNAAKGVKTSRRFVESPKMIDNQFSGSPRTFFKNIGVSIRQLWILLGDS
jgi:hypothetical protein